MSKITECDGNIGPSSSMLKILSAHIGKDSMVGHLCQWQQGGMEVKECSSMNVQESGVTSGEAKFRETQVVNAVRTRFATTILIHVPRPHLVQFLFVFKSQCFQDSSTGQRALSPHPRFRIHKLGMGCNLYGKEPRIVNVVK